MSRQASKSPQQNTVTSRTAPSSKPDPKSQSQSLAASKIESSKPVPASNAPSGFNPAKYARPGLSADDVTRIKECFDIFDYDKSGAISPNELKNAIEALGLEKNAEEILNLINDLDSDGNNEVDFDEFLQIFGFTGEITEEDVLRDLFNQFDVDQRGLVSVDDFKRINDLVGERYSDTELQEMVQYADKDNDQLINWEEFKTVVLKQYS